MINLLNCIAFSFLNHKKYKELRISNLSISIQNRKVYLNSKVYDEYTMEIVTLVDDGEWFDKSERFEIIISTAESEIKFKSGYGNRYMYFKYKDYKSIVNVMIKEIMKIQNKNLKYMKKVI